MGSELYTLKSNNYERDEIIEEYQSVVWAEKYIEPGEVQLVLPATETNYDLVAPGTLLGHSESKQPMLLETREVKEGLITANGKTILSLFKDRIIDSVEFTDYPGTIICTVVEHMQIRAEDAGIAFPNFFIDWPDESGAIVWEDIEGGSAGEILDELAKKYNIGMGVYRLSDGAGGYELRFQTYIGVDKFSTIRFSSDLDNFANVADLYADAEYKTVAITRPPQMPAEIGYIEPPSIAVYNKASDENLPPFRQRVLDVDCTDMTEEDLELDPGATTTQKLNAAEEKMELRARAALDDVKRIDVVDGEVVTSESQIKYWEDINAGDLTYRLGDTVSVVGNYGAVREKIVSEYIRSADQSGIRAYPTLSEPTPAGQVEKPTRKRPRTFIIGPTDEPILEGTVVPPYFSQRGNIVGYRHIFKGGGAASIRVYVNDNLIDTVVVTDTRKVYYRGAWYKVLMGEPVHIEITGVSTDPPPAGLSFSVIYSEPFARSGHIQR